MKFSLPNNFSRQFPIILRRAGYKRIINRKTNKESFVYTPTRDRYPRFHLYITETEQEVSFDLHLDQAATRYEGQKAHRADYETEEVKEELTRIYHVVNSFQNK